jgi:sigma-B regulation protein RsbU (phosphoserine phosphatase)
MAIAFLLVYAITRGILVRHPFPFSMFLGIVSLMTIAYLGFQVFSWVRNKLLWGIRNRLIVAYIFMALVPVILLLTMMGVGLYLLYLQIGAHLLQDDLQDRTGVIAADAEEITNAVTQQIRPGELPTDQALLLRPTVTALITAARAQWPGLRVFLHRARLVNPASGERFAGLVVYRGQLLFASEQERDTANGPVAVLVAAPITPALLDGLVSELGPIQFTLMQPVDEHSNGLQFGIAGRTYVTGERIVSSNRVLPPAVNWLDIPVGGAATLEAYQVQADPDRAPTTTPVPAPVLAAFSLRPSTLNKSLYSSVGAIGPLLVTIVAVCAVVFLILEIAALVTGTILTRTITQSVGDLYDATLHVGRGDFSHRVRVHKRDQLGALGESFNEMTGSITNLIKEQRQRQRLEHEIAIASEVQQELFPKSLPSLPGLELAAICKPARVVSGDYYDFIRIGLTRIGIAIADISGKGIFAALLMASLQAALRSTATLDGNGNTAKLVTLLNGHLFRNTSDDRYATFFYATYDSETHMLSYTNAGHLAPFLMTPDGVQQLDQGGTVVGLFEVTPYTQVTLQVSPGSVLVAFSDGLTEAANVYAEEFGMKRLKDEILRNRELPVQALMERLIAAAEKWTGTAEQADDMTVVVARMG